MDHTRFNKALKLHKFPIKFHQNVILTEEAQPTSTATTRRKTLATGARETQELFSFFLFQDIIILYVSKPVQRVTVSDSGVFGAYFFKNEWFALSRDK